MDMMRDHLHDTPYDMTKDGAGKAYIALIWPMTWSIDGKDYIHERAYLYPTNRIFVCSRNAFWLPNHIGGVNWFGVDDTYLTVYVPMYAGITEVPKSFEVGNGDMATSPLTLLSGCSTGHRAKYIHAGAT